MYMHSHMGERKERNPGSGHGLKIFHCTLRAPDTFALPLSKSYLHPCLYTCTVYHLVYIYVQYIIWFIYMYNISPGLYTCYSLSSGLCTWTVYISSDLYTCTVYNLVYKNVQCIILFIYM